MDEGFRRRETRFFEARIGASPRTCVTFYNPTLQDPTLDMIITTIRKSYHIEYV